MMPENIKRVEIPPIHPSCAVAHASERTPEPMIAVIICALAVHTVPAKILMIHKTCTLTKEELHLLGFSYALFDIW